MMIVNEKIGKIKLELLKEEFIKQIKDSYTLNLSMVLLEEFENLQQENARLKDKIENATKLIEEIKLHYQQYPTMIPSVKINKLEDLLKENYAIIKNIKINDKIII